MRVKEYRGWVERRVFSREMVANTNVMVFVEGISWSGSNRCVVIILCNVDYCNDYYFTYPFTNVVEMPLLVDSEAMPF